MKRIDWYVPALSQIYSFSSSFLVILAIFHILPICTMLCNNEWGDSISRMFGLLILAVSAFKYSISLIWHHTRPIKNHEFYTKSNCYALQTTTIIMTLVLVWIYYLSHFTYYVHNHWCNALSCLLHYIAALLISLTVVYLYHWCNSQWLTDQFLWCIFLFTGWISYNSEPRYLLYGSHSFLVFLSGHGTHRIVRLVVMSLICSHVMIYFQGLFIPNFSRVKFVSSIWKIHQWFILMSCESKDARGSNRAGRMKDDVNSCLCSWVISSHH